MKELERASKILFFVRDNLLYGLLVTIDKHFELHKILALPFSNRHTKKRTPHFGKALVSTNISEFLYCSISQGV